MTDDMMNLRALLKMSPDADFLREMIGYGAQRLMELEVGGLTGAAHGQSDRRTAGARETRPAGRQAVHLRRSRGHQGRRPQEPALGLDPRVMHATGGSAAFTSCAMSRPMPARAGDAWSPPS